MSEHRYYIRISESCIDPNPLIVERQDPDNFPRYQTRKRCALEIAAYVFKTDFTVFDDESKFCWFLFVLITADTVSCSRTQHSDSGESQTSNP